MSIGVDTDASSRDLMRVLRTQHSALEKADRLPESVLWRAYCELRRRGEPDADLYFVRGLKRLHRRRATGGSTLPSEDLDPHEHKLVDDPFLGELWKAYKRCICSHRIGPAAALLRDIEAQLLGN